MLPFTTEEFFQVFQDYNQAIWPSQVIAYLLALICLAILRFPHSQTRRLIPAVLALLWLWMGVGYHWLHFALINPAAWGFGMLFVIQGLLLAWTGVIRGRLRFRFQGNRHGWIGLIFIVYALILYPFLGWWFEHGWPRAPMFGVAPCPTTIFTLGLLLMAKDRVPVHLWIIPVLWSLIGSTAAWLLAVPEDLGLLLAGMVAGGMLLWDSRSRRQSRN